VTQDGSKGGRVMEKRGKEKKMRQRDCFEKTTRKVGGIYGRKPQTLF
jgi:hypothetical protein